MTTTPARRSTRARPSDDELLDAAREVFVEHGFRGTTMLAVADRADSTKPTLYNHFGDKDALHRRLVERESEVCRRWLFGAYETNADLGLEAQVVADTRAFFEYAAAEPSGFRLLMGDDPTRPATEARERLLADVETQVSRRVTDYLRREGWSEDDVARVEVVPLAAILVAVPVSAARRALDTGADLAAAGDLAARFSASALSVLAGSASA